MRRLLVTLLALLLTLALIPTIAVAEGGVAKEDLKIGVVHIMDLSDQGYTYNHDLGCKYMLEALGLDESQYIPKLKRSCPMKLLPNEIRKVTFHLTSLSEVAALE